MPHDPSAAQHLSTSHAPPHDSQVRPALSTSQSFAQRTGPVGVILAVLVAILIGYLTFKVQDIDKRLKAIETKVATAMGGGEPTPPPKPVEIDKVKELFDDKNIIFGAVDRKVLIVEFSDPSCPYCHVAAGLNPELSSAMAPDGRFTTVENGGKYVAPVPAIKKLVDEGKASLVALYANGHGNGEMAGQALYCAQEKGKYWETHDLLYTKAGYDLINDVVKNDKAKAPEMSAFLTAAVDPSFMSECLGSGKYAEKIAQDMAKAGELGFGGTPMFLINGERFNGAYSYTDMEPVVQKFLK